MTAIRHTSSQIALSEIKRLDRVCFPGDAPYPVDGARWWIARLGNGDAVGYCGAKWWAPDNSVYLCRAGVLPSFRGSGLQRRMIDIRVTWARREGAECVFTYTLSNNAASCNSLIRAGFRVYEPATNWAGVNRVIYWRLDLKK